MVTLAALEQAFEMEGLRLRLEDLTRVHAGTTERLRQAEQAVTEAREERARYASTMARRESSLLKDSRNTETALLVKIADKETQVAAAHEKAGAAEERMACVVCLDARREAVPPCGHLSMCMGCAELNVPKKCPICRKGYRLSGMRKVYFS